MAIAAPASADGSKPARAAQAGCAGADTSTSNVRSIQMTLLCLHNLERRAHGLSRLRWNRDLTGVASKYARAMVSRRHFAHSSAGHRDHMDRIAASNYKPAAGCWTAGENLFSSKSTATPRQLLSAWLGSRAHRRNILHSGWHDFGLGVVTTSPGGRSHGLTVVALFGIRTHHPCEGNGGAGLRRRWCSRLRRGGCVASPAPCQSFDQAARERRSNRLPPRSASPPRMARMGTLKPVIASVSLSCVPPAWTNVTGVVGVVASSRVPTLPRTLSSRVPFLPRTSPSSGVLGATGVDSGCGVSGIPNATTGGTGAGAGAAGAGAGAAGAGAGAAGAGAGAGFAGVGFTGGRAPERPVPVPERPEPVPELPESASPEAASARPEPVPESASEESASPEPSGAAATESDAPTVSDCRGCGPGSPGTTRARSWSKDRAEPLHRLQLPKCGWKLVSRTLDLLVVDGRREFLTNSWTCTSSPVGCVLPDVSTVGGAWTSLQGMKRPVPLGDCSVLRADLPLWSPPRSQRPGGGLQDSVVLTEDASR